MAEMSQKTWKLKEKCLSSQQQIPPASHKNSVPSGTFFVYRHEIYQTSHDAGTAYRNRDPSLCLSKGWAFRRYGVICEIVKHHDIKIINFERILPAFSRGVSSLFVLLWGYAHPKSKEMKRKSWGIRKRSVPWGTERKMKRIRIHYMSVDAPAPPAMVSKMIFITS